jgi:hypothetical protein
MSETPQELRSTRFAQGIRVSTREFPNGYFGTTRYVDTIQRTHYDEFLGVVLDMVNKFIDDVLETCETLACEERALSQCLSGIDETHGTQLPESFELELIRKCIEFDHVRSVYTVAFEGLESALERVKHLSRG